MKEEKERKSKSMPVAKILSFTLGLILLFIVFSNSQIMISGTYSPTVNIRPISLVCKFVDLEISKQTTTSNVTGEGFILLAIKMKNGEIEEYIIPSLSILEIEEVGLLSWENGEMLGILPSLTTNGSYIIEHGYITRFGKLGTQEEIEFLIVENLHPLTEIEQAVIQYLPVVQIILIVLLTITFSLILVPLFEMGRKH